MLAFGVRVHALPCSDEGEGACSVEGKGEAAQAPQKVHKLVVD